MQLTLAESPPPEEEEYDEDFYADMPPLEPIYELYDDDFLADPPLYPNDPWDQLYMEAIEEQWNEIQAVSDMNSQYSCPVRGRCF